MTQIIELDDAVSFRAQLTEPGTEPVVLVNVFHVPPDEVDSFVGRWAEGARGLKNKKGFVSTQLHRGIAGSTTFLNYAVWETVADYRAAIEAPDTRAELQKQGGSGTASPHLFRKIEVAGLNDTDI